MLNPTLAVRVALMLPLAATSAGIASAQPAGHTQAASTAAVRQTLEANYTQLARAFKQQDHAAFHRLRLPTFVHIINGKVVPPLNDHQSKQLIKAVTSVSHHIEKLTVKGNQAVVMDRFQRNLIMPTDGHDHKVGIDEVNRDTWVKSGPSWKLKSTERIRVRGLADGQLVPPDGF